MPATLAWNDYEDKPKRQQPRSILIGIMFARTYNVPENMTGPVKGEIMPGESGVLAPRVKSVANVRNNGNGTIQYVVTFIQPQAYS